MEKARGKDLRRQCTLQDGRQCYESGDGVVVSLVPGAGASFGRLRSEELRMEVRYEVDAILDKRGVGDELEYEVRWKVFPCASWEPAANLEGAKVCAPVRAAQRVGRSG